GITVGDPPPAPPTGLSASAGNGQVSLDWDDNTEPDKAGYNVYRSETSGGPYSQVNGTLLATSDYLDLDVVNGTTYYYVVTAVDSATPTPNESGISSEASATPGSQQTMHVESIAMSLVPAGKNIKADATILVYDQSQGPVQGATVVGDWYLNDNLIATGTTGITDGTGYALNTSIPVKAKSGDTFRFEITDVVLSGYIYDAGQGVTSGSITIP
ncbi:MAG: fibronectin type III domain-containing protein, partial [Phycisphaerae bacterium]|nr:fibronectin type III domain-containing protein [Phycisphaerae bacterium]